LPAILIFMTVLVVAGHNVLSSELYSVCVVLRLSAAQIIEAVDMTADPCQDFFQFACGSWNKKHIIPEDKTSYNPFEKLNDELQVILKSKPAAPPCVTSSLA